MPLDTQYLLGVPPLFGTVCPPDHARRDVQMVRYVFRFGVCKCSKRLTHIFYTSHSSPSTIRWPQGCIHSSQSSSDKQSSREVIRNAYNLDATMDIPGTGFPTIRRRRRRSATDAFDERTAIPVTPVDAAGRSYRWVRSRSRSHVHQRVAGV